MPDRPRLRTRRKPPAPAAALPSANRTAKNATSGYSATASLTCTNVKPHTAVTTTRTARARNGVIQHRRDFNGLGYRPCVDVLDTIRPAASRPAHLGHRPLQLPLRLLHAEGGLRARPPVHGPEGASLVRGDQPDRSGLRRSRASRKLRLTGGEPLVRRDLERLVEQLAPLGADLTLTTNGALLPQKAQALADAGLRRITVSLDSLDDEQFRALNDVDFPVERVLEGIDAASAAGLPVKVNAVVKRGVNDDQIVPLAERFRELGHTLRFIEYMDVGHTNGWQLADVVPAREIVALLDDAFGVEPVEAGLPRRGGASLSLPRRTRRGGRDRLGHPAVLRRLHPRAPLGRRPPLHLPLRRARPRPARRPARRRPRTRSWRPGSTRSGTAAPTATRSSARRRPRGSRRSK